MPYFLDFINANILYNIPNRPGASTPPMYSEMLPGGQLLALIIPSLTETMAGTYYCSASYANTEIIESSVDIQTFGKFSTGMSLNIRKKELWIFIKYVSY